MPHNYRNGQLCGEKWPDQKSPHYVLEIKIVVNMKEQNRCLQTQIVAYK